MKHLVDDLSIIPINRGFEEDAERYHLLYVDHRLQTGSSLKDATRSEEHFLLWVGERISCLLITSVLPSNKNQKWFCCFSVSMPLPSFRWSCTATGTFINLICKNRALTLALSGMKMTSTHRDTLPV